MELNPPLNSDPLPLCAKPLHVPNPSWRRTSEFLIPLLLYAAIMVPGIHARVEQINADGVIYIRRADYIAGGNWSASLSGYWSPLISWCIVPLRRLGVDG